MNVLDALRGEHAMLRLMMAAVGREFHAWPDAGRDSAFHLLGHALASHAALEDAVLFDLLSTQHAGLAAALASMHGEHRAIREQINGLIECPKASFAARYAELTETVLDHFAVEERVLFPLVGSAVSETQLQRMGQEWSRRRGVI